VGAILNLLLGSVTICHNNFVGLLQIGISVIIDALFGGIIFPCIHTCEDLFDHCLLNVAGNIDIGLYLAAKVIALIHLKLDAIVDVRVKAAVALAITNINNAANRCSNDLVALGVDVSVDVNAAVNDCSRYIRRTFGSLTTASPANLAAVQNVCDDLISECTSICNPNRVHTIYLALIVAIKAEIAALLKVCVAANVNVDLDAALAVIISTCDTACNHVLNGVADPITSGSGTTTQGLLAVLE